MFVACLRRISPIRKSAIGFSVGSGDYWGLTPELARTTMLLTSKAYDAMDDLLFTTRLLAAAIAMIVLIRLLFQPQKTALHIVWAVFCGSLAIFMVRMLAGDAMGPYQYVVGFGACATCNAYYLVARGLFRKGSAFTRWHLAFAGVISLLVISREAIRFANAMGWADGAIEQGVYGGLGEVLALLGSAVLILTLREGFVGWDVAGVTERRHRRIFIALFGGAIFMCTVAGGLTAGSAFGGQVQSLIEASAAVTVLLITQYLVIRRSTTNSARNGGHAQPDLEPELAKAIQRELIHNQSYLRADLRVSDLADELGVPEYRVSRAVTGALGAANFNQLVNRYRIDHAIRLLANPECDAWSILVISLESGFASIGPFNRAFKDQTGVTPSRYRRESRQVHSRPPVPS